MSSSGSFVTVGRVKDAHGLKGELFIVLYSGEAAWLDKLKTLRLRSPGGDLREAAVRSARLHKNGLIALSPDVVGRNEAEKLRGHELEVPEEFFVSEPGETLYLREVEGFDVVRPDGSAIGPIVAFSSNGAQDLLIVRTARGEFPVPFVDDWVEEIQYEDRRVVMDIPFGLLGEDDESDDASDDASDAASKADVGSESGSRGGPGQGGAL